MGSGSGGGRQGEGQMWDGTRERRLGIEYGTKREGGGGWRREKWEGLREGVMGMSVGKEEQEWEWEGEWV